MIIEEIIKQLIENQVPIGIVHAFSKLPGIYAFSFIGKEFPLKGFKLAANRIIYIGKTESSQQSRNANAHFKTGRTGSSRVRKGIGTLLSQNEEIIPIIRSTPDFIKGRTSHFKCDNISEEKITEWMLRIWLLHLMNIPTEKKLFRI